MKKIRLVAGAVLLAAFSIAAPVCARPGGGQAHHASVPLPQKVTSVRGERPLRTYAVEGSSASFVGRIPREAVQLQADVLARSPNGFVQVLTVDGPVWLKQSDVMLFPADGPAAVVRCNTISQVSDTTTGAVRGAGEGC